MVTLTLEEKDTSERLSSVDKLLPAFNAAGTWLIVAAAAVNVTNVLGIDVSPLLAFGGISGIAVGIGSQQFIQSLLAGVNLVSCAGPGRAVPRSSGGGGSDDGGGDDEDDEDDDGDDDEDD